ncbi:MAG: glycoside hydrolase family 9 protein [Phycisphaerae bacterium]
MQGYSKYVVCVLTVLLVGLLSGSGSADDERLILRDFRAAGADFAFLQWEKAVKQGPEGLEVGGPQTRGQGGFGVNAAANLGAFGDAVPVIRVKLGEHNQATRINLNITDGDGTELTFRYLLSGASREQFTVLYPVSGAELSSDIAINKPGDVPGMNLETIKSWSVVGDWSGQTVHLVLQEIAVTRDIPQSVLQSRAEAVEETRVRVEREQRQAEQERQKLERMLSTGVEHHPDGPRVERVYPIGPTMIGIEIQDRFVEPVGQVYYEPQPGDQIKRDGREVWTWENGEPVLSKIHLEVMRPREGAQPERLGSLAIRAGKVWREITSTGRPITPETLGEAAAYRVSSDDDERYAQPVQPVQVHVKRKPNAYRGQATMVRVYLELPEPLQAGRTYTVGFQAVNTAQPSVSYTHETRGTRSEAVHVSHIGFRPDDPFKQGKLSLWLGTGGAHEFAADGQPPRFEVVDEATGEAVFTGRAELAKAADDSESHVHGRNYAQTPVYTLDFSSLNRPGAYRIYVENVGCSYPFRIAEDTWAEAFRLSMEGVLVHRSGVEMNVPGIEFRRPRTMHPEDAGFDVYPLSITRLEGETAAVQKAATELVESGELPTPLPNAWGGYMDAGDWDRRANHLDHSYLLLELYEIFPDRFRDLKLNLPTDEADDNLPDLLNEALWNLAFYRRMQEPDGGVRGGIESTEHPRKGEASWQESLFVGAFAPDPVSSQRFAGKAAKFARLVADLNPALAAEYRQAAIKAWDWSEAHGDEVMASLSDSTKKTGYNNVFDQLNTARNLAAVELYWLTGDEKYHQVFKETTMLATMDRPRQLLREGEALFAYARLPDHLGDAASKDKARMFITTMADRGLVYGDGNSFGITSTDSMPPMGWVHYFSVPSNNSVSIPRAYVLTGDQKYLAGLIRAANFAAGCNPDNRALTTGLGHDPVRWPLHLDSRVSGQWAPRGITVCGQSDPAERYTFEDWAHTWIFANTMVPHSRTWPAYEAYSDIAVLASMNEYTINAILRNAYNWGILAARPDLAN